VDFAVTHQCQHGQQSLHSDFYELNYFQRYAGTSVALGVKGNSRSRWFLRFLSEALEIFQKVQGQLWHTLVCCITGTSSELVSQFAIVYWKPDMQHKERALRIRHPDPKL